LRSPDPKLPGKARIDHRQEITRFHILPFGEEHLLQFAIHAGVHCDGVERLDCPEAIEIDRRIFLLDLSRDHRHRGRLRLEIRRLFPKFLLWRLIRFDQTQRDDGSSTMRSKRRERR
jgi:hypothetical protein